MYVAVYVEDIKIVANYENQIIHGRNEETLQSKNNDPVELLNMVLELTPKANIEIRQHLYAQVTIKKFL